MRHRQHATATLSCMLKCMLCYIIAKAETVWHYSVKLHRRRKLINEQMDRHQESNLVHCSLKI